jgi:hypothetical protein
MLILKNSIVNRIYNEYLEGKSYQKIADGLEADRIKTGAQGSKWWDSTISKIPRNEKYYGELLQQKTVTVDFLSHKRVTNRNYADRYIVEDNHEPIVSREVWGEIQKKKEKRALAKNNILYVIKITFSL